MVGVADRRGTNAEGLLGIFYVLDFGATGDGQHDDAGGIQAAISAAAGAGGGLVAIPPGVYRLGRAVVWGSAANVTVWQHSGVTFTGPGSLPAAAGSNNIRVEPSGALVGGVPSASAEGDVAAAGATGIASDSGHVHGRESFGGPGVVQVFGDTAAAGAAATPSRSDHRHGIPSSPASMQQGVNNGQEVWQRGNGPFTLNNAYAADRWQLILAGTDALSVSKDTTAANRLANSGAASTLTFTLGTGAGASRYKQRLTIADGYQHLLGQPLPIRVPAKGNAANAVRAFVTTDGTGGTTTFSAFHSGGSTFENLDVANVVVPADATFIDYGLALAATVTVSLDNVMPTTTTTPQPFSGLTPADDMARCQRYCRKLVTYVFGHYQAAGFPIRGSITFAPMAAAPTVTFTNSTLTNCTGLGAAAIGATSTELFATVTALGDASVTTDVLLEANV